MIEKTIVYQKDRKKTGNNDTRIEIGFRNTFPVTELKTLFNANEI